MGERHVEYHRNEQNVFGFRICDVNLSDSLVVLCCLRSCVQQINPTMGTKGSVGSSFPYTSGTNLEWMRCCVTPRDPTIECVMPYAPIGYASGNLGQYYGPNEE